MANCQSFLPQIYELFNIHILFGGHSPKFSSQIIQTAVFPLYGYVINPLHKPNESWWVIQVNNCDPFLHTLILVI